jgi:hypothetical protein
MTVLGQHEVQEKPSRSTLVCKRPCLDGIRSEPKIKVFASVLQLTAPMYSIRFEDRCNLLLSIFQAPWRKAPAGVQDLLESNAYNSVRETNDSFTDEVTNIALYLTGRNYGQ